jgi:hypothetical protein
VQLTGLDVYQRTLLLQQQGFTPAQIRAAGCGESIVVQWELTEPNPNKPTLRLDYQTAEMPAPAG